MNDIFSNLLDILKVNTELYSQLSERITSEIEMEDDVAIADIFINMSPFLKIYAVFAKNYAYSLKVIGDLNRKNSDFANFYQVIGFENFT